MAAASEEAAAAGSAEAPEAPEAAAAGLAPSFDQLSLAAVDMSKLGAHKSRPGGFHWRNQDQDQGEDGGGGGGGGGAGPSEDLLTGGGGGGGGGVPLAGGATRGAWETASSFWSGGSTLFPGMQGN